jgi:hypothetical protein
MRISAVVLENADLRTYQSVLNLRIRICHAKQHRTGAGKILLARVKRFAVLCYNEHFAKVRGHIRAVMIFRLERQELNTRRRLCKVELFEDRVSTGVLFHGGSSRIYL